MFTNIYFSNTIPPFRTHLHYASAFLHYVTVSYGELRYVTVRYGGALRLCVTVRYRALRCVTAVRYGALRCVTVVRYGALR